MHYSNTHVGYDVLSDLDGSYFDELNEKMQAVNGHKIIPGSGTYYFWTATETYSNDALHANFYKNNININGYDKTSNSNCYRSVLAY